MANAAAEAFSRSGTMVMVRSGSLRPKRWIATAPLGSPLSRKGAARSRRGSGCLLGIYELGVILDNPFFGRHSQETQQRGCHSCLVFGVVAAPGAALFFHEI